MQACPIAFFQGTPPPTYQRRRLFNRKQRINTMAIMPYGTNEEIKSHPSIPTGIAAIGKGHLTSSGLIGPHLKQNRVSGKPLNHVSLCLGLKRKGKKLRHDHLKMIQASMSERRYSLLHLGQGRRIFQGDSFKPASLISTRSGIRNPDITQPPQHLRVQLDRHKPKINFARRYTCSRMVGPQDGERCCRG